MTGEEGMHFEEQVPLFERILVFFFISQRMLFILERFIKILNVTVWY